MGKSRRTKLKAHFAAHMTSERVRAQMVPVRMRPRVDIDAHIRSSSINPRRSSSSSIDPRGSSKVRDPEPRVDIGSEVGSIPPDSNMMFGKKKLILAPEAKTRVGNRKELLMGIDQRDFGVRRTKELY